MNEHQAWLASVDTSPVFWGAYIPSEEEQTLIDTVEETVRFASRRTISNELFQGFSSEFEQCPHGLFAATVLVSLFLKTTQLAHGAVSECKAGRPVNALVLTRTLQESAIMLYNIVLTPDPFERHTWAIRLAAQTPRKKWWAEIRSLVASYTPPNAARAETKRIVDSFPTGLNDTDAALVSQAESNVLKKHVDVSPMNMLITRVALQENWVVIPSVKAQIVKLRHENQEASDFELDMYSFLSKYAHPSSSDVIQLAPDDELGILHGTLPSYLLKRALVLAQGYLSQSLMSSCVIAGLESRKSWELEPSMARVQELMEGEAS